MSKREQKQVQDRTQNNVPEHDSRSSQNTSRSGSQNKQNCK